MFQEKFFKLQLALLPVMQAVDFLTTATFTSQGKPELNPIINYLISNHGIWSMALMKIAITVPPMLIFGHMFKNANKEPDTKFLKGALNTGLALINIGYTLYAINNIACILKP